MEFQTGFLLVITNYLDDFLIVAYTVKMCNDYMKQFLQLCTLIGCRTSLEKTEWASSLMIFLGMLLNGKTFTILIPLDKRTKAINQLKKVLAKNKCKVKTVQQLAGLLNFLNRAIVPGRTFTRSMYDKLKLKDKKGNTLKQYHHVQLDRQFRLDAQMWLSFLENSDNQQLCRPFIDLADSLDAHMLRFYTDASKNVKLGMGAVFENRWMYAQWDENFVNNEDPSIEFLELFALCAAILAWGNWLTQE